MSTAVQVKRGDVGAILADTLNADGLANLNNATAVLLLLREYYTDVLLTFTATIISSTARTVQYVIQSGDLVEGVYRQEWQVTFVDASVLTFPSRGTNWVFVGQDLNPPT